MKISKLFHTLYAFLMFLPVMVLPLFAININQKEVEPLTAQIEETQIITFNNIIDSYKNWSSFGVVATVENDVLLIKTNDIPNDISRYYSSFNYIPTNKYYVSVVAKSNTNTSFVFGVGTEQSNNYVLTNEYQRYSFDFYSADSSIHTYVGFSINEPVDNSLYFKDFMIIDLTSAFGSNIPNISDLNNLFDWHYSYGEHKLLYHTGVLDTLNNTDVGSQFLYSLYNPLKDYFNLPNYMNLGGLYDLFLINLFSGYNSPVYFIIFDLMIYWLAMSILWLIFDVLMYVPSMIHKMLDKARME